MPKLLQITYIALPLLLSLLGLFLSLWIVLPGPTMPLFRLSVGAPEISPWLIGLNGVALLLALIQWNLSWLGRVAVGVGVVALLLSFLPLIQLVPTNRQLVVRMEQGLGADYLSKIPLEQWAQMRSQPFNLGECFTGIPLGSAAVRLTLDVPFATPDGVPLKLDVYRPPQGKSGDERHPTVVMIHGGAWQGGSRRDYAQLNEYLAARGYTVIALTYRFAPQYRFPSQLEDVRSALEFIQQHSGEYEVDLARMAVMGRSAGAHLALLAAYQPGSLSDGFKAVVSYYGPTNLVQGYQDPPRPDPIDTRKVLEALMGGTPEWRLTEYQRASPLYVPETKFPPTLLVYGKRDHIVKASFGRQLFERLRASNNTAILLEIPWAEHAFDAIFNGVSSQLALYYTERFLAWALR